MTGRQTDAAHKVEIRVRCILGDSRDNGVRGPAKAQIMQISKMYGDGLKQTPQCVSLMLAFIRFSIMMPYKVHINRAITEKYLDMVVRLCGDDISWTQRLLIWRIRRDLYQALITGSGNDCICCCICCCICGISPSSRVSHSLSFYTKTAVFTALISRNFAMAGT